MPKVHDLNVKSVKRRLPRMNCVLLLVSFIIFLDCLFGILNRLSHVIELYIFGVLYSLIGAYSETRDMDFVR